MKPVFANYLIVDWSAASVPRSGADSIWWALIARQRDGRYRYETGNPETRRRAYQEIRKLLVEAMRESRCTLVGFDFPLGYPSGFAQAMMLAGSPVWRATWKAIAKGIIDRADNGNNRFEFAAECNQRVSDGATPFWGLPDQREIAGLSPTKPPAFEGLPELRICERMARGAKSVWQLHGAGSVGGQALTGIPYVQRLVDDTEIGRCATVWPFETGLSAPFGVKPGDPKIVYAEVYPSLIDVTALAGEPKDRAQVRELARWFARLDEKGKLARLFTGPPRITSQQRAEVESEEGWILGVS